MNVVKSYKDLKVWQKSMEMVKDAYLLSKRLPKDETYALRDQIRRSAVSIPANIADGQGRESDKEFFRFLSIAKGSICELVTQIQLCVLVGYPENSDISQTELLASEVSKMITS